MLGGYFNNTFFYVLHIGKNNKIANYRPQYTLFHAILETYISIQSNYMSSI